MEGLASNWDTIYAKQKAYPGDVSPLRLFKYVSPEFFHTMGTRIIAGRELTWTDVYGFRPVAMVSENLARELWDSIRSERAGTESFLNQIRQAVWSVNSMPLCQPFWPQPRCSPVICRLAGPRPLIP
ncbi:MAG TPA: hypothetical protein VHZ55_07875 [Bryobacteraceae bacterium]|jgi:hypothetical protein|nr:hypothetical protein [Bryobacteraceae bacterium]